MVVENEYTCIIIILQQRNPDVEGSQAAEHALHEEELENVSKVKDPNGGRVSGNPLPTPVPMSMVRGT